MNEEGSCTARSGCLRNRLRSTIRIIGLLGILIVCVAPVWPHQPPADLTKVNIEELINLEVSSASSKEQSVSRTAGAVLVLMQVNLPHRMGFDTSVYSIGRLLDPSMPAYILPRLRFGWYLGEFVDFDLIGQNLLAPRHLEFLNNTGIVPTYAHRGVFARLTWRISQ
jgi:hypothetical protein